jgi:hypothetical protein
MDEGAVISGPIWMAIANKFTKDLEINDFNCGVAEYL